MISTPYALALLRLQMRRPTLRLSLNLRDDREKPSESWWTFAGRVLQEQSGGA